MKSAIALAGSSPASGILGTGHGQRTILLEMARLSARAAKRRETP